MAMRFIQSKQRVINLALQDRHIKHSFPQFVCTSGHGSVVWRGSLQPTQLASVYDVEVCYKLKDVPKVRVLRPILRPNAPHLYADGTLCLFWPQEWLWRSDRIIAETIIPWTALWLAYYELWLDTGQWLGPSSHVS